MEFGGRASKHRVLKIIIEDRKKFSCLLAVFIFILNRKNFLPKASGIDPKTVKT